MYYFAYASNLNRNQMQQRYPNSKPFFKATLPNYKLVFSGFSRQWRGGTATIQFNRGEKVIGAVYDISDMDFRLLDKSEGYPDTYSHLNITVFNEDGDAVEAVTYIKKGQTEEAKPSAEYLSIIQQGFRDWRIV